MSDDIRELAMRLADDAGISSIAVLELGEILAKDGDEGIAAIERLVRAAMREGMLRAGSTVLQVGPKDGPTSLVTRGFYDAIRAEADKLEGK